MATRSRADPHSHREPTCHTRTARRSRRWPNAEASLASRLRAAAGLRNLIAHQYGVIDFRRLFAIAGHDVDDLVAFCQALAVRSGRD